MTLIIIINETRSKLHSIFLEVPQWKIQSRYFKIFFFLNSIDRCTRSSTDEGFLMKVPFCKTERFRKSYFNRIVTYGNLYHKMSEEM